MWTTNTWGSVAPLLRSTSFLNNRKVYMTCRTRNSMSQLLSGRTLSWADLRVSVRPKYEDRFGRRKGTPVRTCRSCAKTFEGWELTCSGKCAEAYRTKLSAEAKARPRPIKVPRRPIGEERPKHPCKQCGWHAHLNDGVCSATCRELYLRLNPAKLASQAAS